MGESTRFDGYWAKEDNVGVFEMPGMGQPCLPNQSAYKRCFEMCGIIGVCSHKPAAPVVVDALERVEYRGSDSAGVAILADRQLVVLKKTGRLRDFEAERKLSELRGNIAIGHTRWATHGAITQANAHPHCDCTGKIAVVHNGIIENYRELRYQLTELGHRFVSETDSEVIPHLIEEEIKKGNPLEAAVMAVIPKLEGSYAFLVVSADEPDKIVGSRKESPLVIGTNSYLTFAASDAIASPEHVNCLVSLGDREIVVLTRDDVSFFDQAGNRLQKQGKSLTTRWNNANKQGYPFFMLKEIMEQPETLEKAATQDKDAFAEIAQDILQAEQVIITACGTSRYAALVGRYYFSRVGHKFCDVVMASEFSYFADSLGKNTLVLSISQSGETADVIDGVKRAKAAGARVISIINRPQSLLAEFSDRVVYLNCGPELGVAATKSFVNQLAILFLLASAMANSFDSAANKLRLLSTKIIETIDWNNDQLWELGRELSEKSDLYCIARGINFAIASEGALKLKEISYIHAEGMPAGELKHGTLALIETGVPVVVVCPRDCTYRETLSNAMEAKSRGAYIIAISDVRDEMYDFWIKVPKVEPLLYPLITVIPLQLLAYHLAISRGHDPDRPRNLAKSVTVK